MQIYCCKISCNTISNANSARKHMRASKHERDFYALDETRADRRDVFDRTADRKIDPPGI